MFVASIVPVVFGDVVPSRLRFVVFESGLQERKMELSDDVLFRFWIVRDDAYFAVVAFVVFKQYGQKGRKTGFANGTILRGAIAVAVAVAVSGVL